MRLCWVLGLGAVLFLCQGTNCARRLNNYNYNYNYNYNKHHSDPALSYSRLLRSPRRGIEPSKGKERASVTGYQVVLTAGISYVPLSPAQSSQASRRVEGRNFILRKLCELGLGQVSLLC